MKNRVATASLLLCTALTGAAFLACTAAPRNTGTAGPGETGITEGPSGAKGNTIAAAVNRPEPKAIDPFMDKGLDWLVKAQHPDGGWGAGSHASQQIRDPHAVSVDPATTSFTAMAFIRVGHTPYEGKHKETVRKALEYVLTTVEKASNDGPKITELTGTQIQAKLGPTIDTSMASQFLARVLPHVEKHDAKSAGRVTEALDTCLRKIEKSQQSDGSWNNGGWAPVLQSAMNNSALEVAEMNGRPVDATVLTKARNYQMENFDEKSGKVSADAGAGVALYALGGAQKGGSKLSYDATQLVEQAKERGDLPADAKPTAETLESLGVATGEARSAARAIGQSEAAVKMLDGDGVMAGFGNNGGEEFLSHMLTSESLVVRGGEDWEKWTTRMHDMLAKIQNTDGSWSGHHCITSPVFCTAAVLACLTADREQHVKEEVALVSDTAANSGKKK